MKGPQIHRDDFKEMQNKGETLKWVRKRTKSGEKKTRQDKFDEFISPDEGLFERNM